MGFSPSTRLSPPGVWKQATKIMENLNADPDFEVALQIPTKALSNRRRMRRRMPYLGKFPAGGEPMLFLINANPSNLNSHDLRATTF